MCGRVVYVCIPQHRPPTVISRPPPVQRLVALVRGRVQAMEDQVEALEKTRTVQPLAKLKSLTSLFTVRAGCVVEGWCANSGRAEKAGDWQRCDCRRRRRRRRAAGGMDGPRGL